MALHHCQLFFNPPFHCEPNYDKEMDIQTVSLFITDTSVPNYQLKLYASPLNMTTSFYHASIFILLIKSIKQGTVSSNKLHHLIKYRSLLTAF